MNTDVLKREYDVTLRQVHEWKEQLNKEIDNMHQDQRVEHLNSKGRAISQLYGFKVYKNAEEEK